MADPRSGGPVIRSVEFFNIELAPLADGRVYVSMLATTVDEEEYAAAVLGEVDVRGHSEMPVCWRPLLRVLTDVIPVLWVAGPRPVPNWLSDTSIEVWRTDPTDIIPILNSCATPQHEMLEAFRWMRALLAEGRAKPEEISIAAASPADFDDHVLALSLDANIPLHFVQGIKAVAMPDGQTAAALADILVKGISQGRVRRLCRAHRL